MNTQDFRGLQEAYNQVYQLDEISQKTAIRAYAASKTGEFEGADSDRDLKRTDNLERHIRRKFGDKAVKHAERAADAQTFGRKDASGKSKKLPKPRIEKSDYRTTEDGKMHKQDQRELKTELRIKRDRRLRAARAANTNEQVDLYDIILSHLLDEGYAETVEAAEVMMVSMSEELTGERRKRALEKGTPLATRVATGREGKPVERRNRSGDITMRTTTKAPTKRGGGGEKGQRKADWSGWEADRGSKKRTQKEQVDIYDIILSHLLDEGYAETVEAAEVMMVNMSEEWRDSIIG